MKYIDNKKPFKLIKDMIKETAEKNSLSEQTSVNIRPEFDVE